MKTRILFGILIASDDARFTLNADPCSTAPPVVRLVPACRTTVDRPGSIVNLIVVGARPLVTSAIRDAPVFGTLTVKRPLPRLLIFSVPVATPRLHSSTARNTVVVSGCRIG